MTAPTRCIFTRAPLRQRIIDAAINVHPVCFVLWPLGFVLGWQIGSWLFGRS